jgi:transposase
MPISMSRDEIRAVYRQGEDAVVSLIEILISRFNALEEKVAGLEAQLGKANEEITRLKAQIAKDSHNSSKPPSSDMYHAPKNLREKSSRRNGGQPGHQGHTLQRVENPDIVKIHRLNGCCRCGRQLSRGKLTEYKQRQVFDLPPARLEVTEHRAEVRRCRCGKQHTAQFPEGVAAPVQYGNRIRATMVYFSSYQLVPQNRLVEAMRDLFNVQVSEGTLNSIIAKAHDFLEKTEEAIKARIRGSPIMCMDETGMYVKGERWWEHGCSTDRFTHYYCHVRRGKEAMKDGGMIEGYTGRAIHDGWASYFDFDCRHGLCNAHHLRELVFVKEELNQRWAGQMIEHLCHIKKTVGRAKDGGRHALASATIRSYQQRYSDIIDSGYRVNPISKEKRKPGQRGRLKQSPARNLLDRLSNHAEETLAFMSDLIVPFDNNLSERDIRMTKIKQKVSGCFRSESGAQAFCRIRGFISTIRKHGLNVLDQLIKCFDYRGMAVLLPE